MRRPLLLSAFAILALSACDAPETDDAALPGETASSSASGLATVGEEGQGEAQMPYDDAQADDGQCGADKLDRWLNVLPTQTVKDEIAATVGERAIRYYTQGDPITMDFSPSRLNVELGADGRIKLFRCG